MLDDYLLLVSHRHLFSRYSRRRCNEKRVTSIGVFIINTCWIVGEMHTYIMRVICRSTQILLKFKSVDFRMYCLGTGLMLPCEAQEVLPGLTRTPEVKYHSGIRLEAKTSISGSLESIFEVHCGLSFPANIHKAFKG